MKIEGLLQNQRFATVFYIACGLVVLFLFANLTVFAGDDFFEFSNSIISPLVAFLASALFFYAAENRKDSVSRKIWLGMAWGFALWGLADLIWTVLPWMNIELSIPSVVDLIWIIGYIPLYYAFVLRVRSIRVPSNPAQRWAIMAASVAWLAVTFAFVLRHIIADFDQGRLWEWVTNLSYPLADLGLAILASHTLILLKDGRFSTSWRLILMGVAIMALSDLIYLYAVWFGMYYPETGVNLLTIAVDTTYSLAYASVSFGIFTYIHIWRIKEKHLLHAEITPANRFYAFVGTNTRDEIITASDNFHYLVNASSDSTFHHQPLYESLGVSAEDFQALNQRLVSQSVITHEQFTIRTFDSLPREIWLTAVAIFDPDLGYNGANFALSAEIDVPNDARLPKNKELLGMLNYLISIAGARPKEDIRLIRGYFLDTIQLLSSFVEQFGGAQYKKALFERLDRVVTERNLPIKIDNQTIIFPEESDEETLARSVVPLINAAQRFASDLVGEDIIRDDLEEYRHQQSDMVLRNLDKYHLKDDFLAHQPERPSPAAA